MKKIQIILLIIINLTLMFYLPVVNAKSDFYQNEYPYETYTVDYEGNLTFTQTAYTPVGVLNRNVMLMNPEDIYIKDELVYIADTGNSRVAVLDYDGNLVKVIGLGDLAQPTGVFVSEEDYLYVADKENKLVYKYDLDGILITTFDRPSEPLFGQNSPYIPMKVAVGSGENIYIIGDGSTSGVIQLNYDGSFLGYFGVNLSDKSLIDRIAEVFVKPGVYASNIPPSPTNITINNKSLVYTSTPNTTEALKKLDVNGNNILTTTNYNEENNIVDLSVNDLGYVYAIYDDGLIVEYDPNGNLLFGFDVVKSTSNVLGLIQTPSGIQVDKYQNIFVLDKGRSEIITYQPSVFTDLVHEAINLYNQGLYEDSTLLFESILSQNDNFALAHSSLGKAYYQEGNYDLALNEYRKASDIGGYSTTYWKIRDIWLSNNLGLVFTLSLVFFALMYVVKLVNKRTKVFESINTRIKTIKKRPDVRRFTLLFFMMKHPIDASYEIKREKRSNIFTASILLVILFIEYLLYLRYTGFIFTGAEIQIRLGMEIFKFFGVIILFIFSNYLIATLSDGEGFLRDVFVSIVYSLAPIIILLPFYIILSNVLTLNELIILQILSFVMISYTLTLVFVSVREIHNYEIKQTFKNILMTLFTMLIIILIGFIIYVFGSQLTDFLKSFIKEVWFRVFN
ncbi:MAG: YIP1 family protein [Candidatus Izimaplasma sp.]|nr:YIP1 family protein [Candidatus Izimaplasma bacterium]